MHANLKMNVLFFFAAGLLYGYPGLAGIIQGHVRSSSPVEDLSNFVIWVEDIEGTFPAPKEPVIMDQKGLSFLPHVLVVLIGTWVEFPNSDPMAHNVFSISDAKRFNLGLYQRGTVRRQLFDSPGVVVVLCNVHLAMSGYIVVVKNPFFDQTDPKGTYCIDGVPPGRHRVRCWGERSSIKETTVGLSDTDAVTVDFLMGK